MHGLINRARIVVGCFVVACSPTSTPAPEVDVGVDAAAEQDATADAGNDPDPAPASNFIFVHDTIVAGSETRPYLAVVPKALEPAAALVLVLHADGGAGDSMHAYFPFENASQNGAVVVYPSGKDGGSWQLYTPPAEGGDFPYFEALFAQMQIRYGTDPARVFLVGWSQGAFYANQFSCWRSHLVRGIVSISGGAPDQGGQNVGTKWPNGSMKCTSNEGPVAQMAIHGTADSTVDIGSGQYSAYYWAAVNGCSDTAVVASKAFVPCNAYGNCPAGNAVLFCPIQGGTHGIWNGSAALGWKFLQTLH